MKAVVLSLVLANLGFWAWASWIADEPGAPLPATPEPAVTQLELIERERPAASVAIADITGPGADAAAEPDAAARAANATPASRPAQEVDVTELPLLVPAPARSTERPSPADALAVRAIAAERQGAVETEVETEVAAEVDTVVAEDAEQEPAVEISQVDASDSGSVAEDTTVALAAARGPDYERCATLGPFLNLRQAGAAARALRARELSPSQRPEEDQVWVGHWVHLPPYPSREAAILVVDRLRAEGVTDIYIEPSGAMQHAVSLGLFSDAARAETRAGDIRQLGVRPQIRDRHRTDLVHWLDFKLAPGQTLDPAEFSPRPDQVIRLIERECDSQ